MTAAIASTVTSSYAGGASLTITGSGFYEGSLKGLNKIEVCGTGSNYECTVTSAAYDSVTCALPPVVTVTT